MIQSSSLSFAEQALSPALVAAAGGEPLHPPAHQRVMKLEAGLERKAVSPLADTTGDVILEALTEALRLVQEGAYAEAQPFLELASQLLPSGAGQPRKNDSSTIQAHPDSPASRAAA